MDQTHEHETETGPDEAEGQPAPPSGWLARLRKTEAGQTLVEFSLVLPVFLLLIFALVDFGRAFYTWLLITNAAREGARAGAVQMTDAQINNRVFGSICSSYPSQCGGLNAANMTVTKNNVQGPKGQTMWVEVQYSFTYVTPINNILSLMGQSTLANPVIKSRSSMRLE
jgi:Flp pilus assembly protein TadG